MQVFFLRCIVVSSTQTNLMDNKPGKGSDAREDEAVGKEAGDECQWLRALKILSV
jgi:hypothetical protein